MDTFYGIDSDGLTDASNQALEKDKALYKFDVFTVRHHFSWTGAFLQYLHYISWTYHFPLTLPGINS